MNLIIRFLKRIFVPIINKFKDKRSILINNSYFYIRNFYINNTKLSNIILYTFLGLISYYFVYDLNIFKAVQIIIFTLISLAISTYISDNFKLSNNIFIKILQKFVFINIKIALIVLILISFVFFVFIFVPYIYPLLKYIFTFINSYFIYVKVFTILMLLLTIIYFIIELRIIDKFSKLDAKPVYSRIIPHFIKSELDLLYSISKFTAIEKDIVVNHIIKTMLFLIILFLIMIIFILITLNY